MDQRTALLLALSCTVLGCGAVGSSVAARLARAGVGRLRLVDCDTLEWSNIGRHELGAGSIGQNKAKALARRLAEDFPHLTIDGFAMDAHSVMERQPELLSDSDLVLVTTGSWQADGALNKWHIANGRRQPFLYGWTESHAAAAHAVMIASEGGCLRCGLGPTGLPSFEASFWPEGATLEEPACGNHFHPYGAIELGFVVDLIADTALAGLLATPDSSSHTLWFTRMDRLKAGGGHWTTEAENLLGSGVGGCVTTRPWPAMACPACSDPERARA